MKHPRLSFHLVSAVVAAIAAGVLAAPGVALACYPTIGEFPIAVGAEAKALPATDGGMVVWQADDGSGGWQIQSYDVATETGGVVSSESTTETAPSVWSPWVVWQDGRDGGQLVYGRDLQGAPLDGAISPSAGSQSAPAVCGGYAVWSDTRDGGADIYAYDLAAAVEFPVCTAAGDQTEPAVWASSEGIVVVWTDGRSGSADIYGATVDPATRVVAEFPVCTAAGDQTQPAVQGSRVVWTDARSGAGTDIWVYDMAAVAESRVSCSKAASKPDVSGTLVVWEDAGCDAGNPDVRGCDLNWGVQFAVCQETGAQTDPDAAGNLVVWADTRENPDGDIYGASVSLWEAGVDAASGLKEYGGAAYTRSAAVTLRLAAQSSLAAVTQMSFSDDGSAWQAWEPFAATKSYQLASAGVDGRKRVYVRYQDVFSAVSPVKGQVFVLDRGRPRVVSAVSCTVRRGRAATLHFRVNDGLSPRVKVIVSVRTAAGRSAKTLVFTGVPTGRTVERSFDCNLARGSYRYTVMAFDLARNRQARTASAALYVR